MGRCEEATCYLAVVQTLDELRATLGEEAAYELLKKVAGVALVIDPNGWMNQLLHTYLNEESGATAFFAAVDRDEELSYCRDGSCECVKADDVGLRGCDIALLTIPIVSCERWGYGREGSNAGSADVPPLAMLSDRLRADAARHGMDSCRIRLVCGLHAG